MCLTSFFLIFHSLCQQAVPIAQHQVKVALHKAEVSCRANNSVRNIITDAPNSISDVDYINDHLPVTSTIVDPC